MHGSLTLPCGHVSYMHTVLIGCSTLMGLKTEVQSSEASSQTHLLCAVLGKFNATQ